MKYTFNTVNLCNMCASKTNTHKILGKRLNGSQGKNPKNKIGITTTIIKCIDCGLIYSNPQPIPNNIQDHYGVPPENYWKEQYFEVNENYFASEIKKLERLMKTEKGMKVLDIGAGLGKCMIALERAGYDAYGFEPSEPFYKQAISRMKINPDKLKLSMIEDVDYPENSFDFITFGAVLEHLYNPSESIIKAMKWLKPNGLIQIEVPSSDWLIGKLANIYFKLIGTDYVTNLSPMHSPFHLYEFGLKSFEKNGKMNNYEVIHYEYYPCSTYLPFPLDKLTTEYMKMTNTGMQLCVWLKKK